MSRLGGADKVSTQLLEEWPGGLCYRPGIETTRDLTRAKVEEHFTDGSSVFHDGDPFERYFFMRVKNYGHVGTMVQAMIDEARVVATLDKRTPQMCEMHDGKRFSVQEAFSKIKWMKSLSQEEYSLQVYGKDHGFPPFSFECICRMEGIIEGVEY